MKSNTDTGLISGCRYDVGSVVSGGGQGILYSACNTSTREDGVAKFFHGQFEKSQVELRTRFLINHRLDQHCPAICAPKDLFNNGRGVGHFTRRAPGVPASQFLANEPVRLVDQIQLGIAVARVVHVLESRGLAHGDIQADNFLVARNNGVIECYMIDFDNFFTAAPNIPPPPMIGSELYLAPELRRAMHSNQFACPSIQSDRFALSVVLHEILFLRHPASGRDIDQAMLDKTMSCGHWPDEAPVGGYNPSLGGYPVTAMNSDIRALFRRAFSLDPHLRPSAAEWVKVLTAALFCVSLCPFCRCAIVVDPSKTHCPHCHKPFPILKLRFERGISIPVDKSAILIGRNEIPGPMVSSRHACIRRVGPETYLESYGVNGTFRSNGSDWIRLPQMQPILLQSGDKIRVADMLATVEPA
jgi:serine/threonine protein kinase